MRREIWGNFRSFETFNNKGYKNDQKFMEAIDEYANPSECEN